MANERSRRFVTSPLFLVMLAIVCIGGWYELKHSSYNVEGPAATQHKVQIKTSSALVPTTLPQGNICEIPGDQPGLNDKRCPAWLADVGYPCQCPDKSSRIGAVCSTELAVGASGACHAEPKQSIAAAPRAKAIARPEPPLVPEKPMISEPEPQPEPVVLPIPPEDPAFAHIQYLKNIKKGEVLLGTKAGGVLARGSTKWDACGNTNRTAQEHCAIGLKRLSGCECEREFSGTWDVIRLSPIWSCKVMFECLPNAEGRY